MKKLPLRRAGLCRERNLLEAVDGLYGTGNNLRRQPQEAQGLVIFLTASEAPLDALLERCKLVRIVVLPVQ